MPEHLIRLRGPWEFRFPTDPGIEPIRLSLPADALPIAPNPMTILRQFGRPARGSASMTCSLRCESVPGLLTVHLNGEPLIERSPENALSTDPIEVPIATPLRPRNRLELTVLGKAASFTSPERPWGSVALVFTEQEEVPRVDESNRLTR